MNISKLLLINCKSLIPALEDFIPENLTNSSFVLLLYGAAPLLTQCDEILESLDVWEVRLNVALCLVILLGLLLNLFVVSVLIVDKAKTSSDYYLISISLGDITICVGTFITSQLTKIYTGAVLQVVGDIIGNLGMFACLTTVMVLTAERYFAIKDPLSSLYTCNQERSTKIVLLTWASLIVYCTLTQIFILNFPCPDSDELYHINRLLFVFYLNFSLFYLIPVVVSATLYGVILRIIHQRELNIRRLMGGCGSTYRQSPPKPTGRRLLRNEEVGCGKNNEIQASPADTKDTPRQGSGRSGCSADEDRIRKLLSLRKMLKMFLLVLLSFVVLMSPYRWLMFSLGIHLKVTGGQSVTGWNVFYHMMAVGCFSILYACNSIVNPTLYNILAKRFRLKLVSLASKAKTKFQKRPQFDARKGAIPLDKVDLPHKKFSGVNSNVQGDCARKITVCTLAGVKNENVSML